MDAGPGTSRPRAPTGELTTWAASRALARPSDTDEHSVFGGRAREVDQLTTLLRLPRSGHTLASAGDDNTVSLWNVTSLKWLRTHAMEHACAITGGGLIPAEWTRYAPGVEYADVCAIG